MTHEYFDYIEPEVTELLSMGFSTKKVAAHFNMNEKTLIQLLDKKKRQRDIWQKKVNEKYGNHILEY